jgi:hypothetical protein
MRIRVSPTPSNTASNTPTNTSSGTACPTSTPTNSLPPTNTPTSTSTPTPTSCYNPQAYILFDSSSGATALNSWMLSNGSAFRGMNLNVPSTTFAIFQSQMNAYISYSGFGTTTFALFPTSITPNQDPIQWLFGPDWTGVNTWVNMLVPTCPICDDGVYTLVGKDGNINNSTNPTYRSFEFYYSGTSIPQGYYRLHTTFGNTGMRLANSSLEYGLGSLSCPATPTPTNTATPTITPTMTSTPFEVCPNELFIDGLSGAWPYPDQSYYRKLSYTGGTFIGGYYYFDGVSTTFIPGASPSGITYSVYGAQSGSTYYTLLAYTSNLSTYQWRVFASNGASIIDGGSGSSTALNTNAVLNSTTTGGITYPKPGIQNTNWASVIYPSICTTLTPTPTNTSTPTMTPTQTGTIQSTPTNTPTNTATNTPTGTIVSTPTNTATPSPTPVCLHLDIQTNASLDITITTISVDALLPSVIGGTLPNTPGNGTNLCYDLSSGTYEVRVYTNCSISGQRVSINSPTTGYECQNVPTGSNVITFASVGFDGITYPQVFAEDGTC